MTTMSRTGKPNRWMDRSARRVAIVLGTALLAGIGLTGPAEPAQANPIGLMPDCSNRKSVQTKTTGLTMNVWFYNKDRKKIAGKAKYRWSYTGTMYTFDAGLRQWTKAGTVKHTCTGK